MAQTAGAVSSIFVLDRTSGCHKRHYHGDFGISFSDLLGGLYRMSGRMPHCRASRFFFYLEEQTFKVRAEICFFFVLNSMFFKNK